MGAVALLVAGCELGCGCGARPFGFEDGGPAAGGVVEFSPSSSGIGGQ